MLSADAISRRAAELWGEDVFAPRRVERVGPHTLILGDCREALSLVREAQACVTDPPYELGFMGKSWDASGIANSSAVWGALLGALRPGAHVLAFSGSRTYHRMTSAIEDAGFEIRDQIMWLYGSGFPKSLDVSKAIDKAAGAEREKIAVGNPVKRMIPGADQNGTGSWIKDNGRVYQPGVEVPATDAAKEWDGWGTALKPAHEPICVARKPLIGTVAENVLTHGSGALNLDGCRVPTDETIVATRNVALGSSSGGIYSAAQVPGVYNQKEGGRWPANIIHDGSDEVLAAFPSAPGQLADASTDGSRRKTQNVYGDMKRGSSAGPARGDSGSAARFFYCAKASKKDRGEGNSHPTVKPHELMRYLCRLVTPPGGLIVDPFMGSGSTGVAAIAEGFRFVGIEQDEAYFEIALKRIRTAFDAG
ncbi:Adenine-specific methyltransferase [Hyphomicrobium sulfonivorans]|uniref:Methyltransferase n=1 Tax=Hyphomicrobium sulfonivorans TaxID=121290 RepID=A0A109BP65_HYPSL|nr:site-specific DNA-methyltransferase [Hyphomicrobium sulfonivorans]KWT72393.1 Adenine-specific methyltransferase [Hyphomicrobium sulfonivorans]